MNTTAENNDLIEEGLSSDQPDETTKAFNIMLFDATLCVIMSLILTHIPTLRSCDGCVEAEIIGKGTLLCVGVVLMILLIILDVKRNNQNKPYGYFSSHFYFTAKCHSLLVLLYFAAILACVGVFIPSALNYGCFCRPVGPVVALAICGWAVSKRNERYN